MIKYYEELSKLINGKSVLITGGTGSLGKQLTKIFLENFSPKKLIIYSRDEFKQFMMKKKYSDKEYKCLRYFIGDIRDLSRLRYAFRGVDIVIHTAALKQVDAIEYNPIESVKTNINGTINIIDAAIESNVKIVMGISTDKCVKPTNMYGATKMCFEKLIINANVLGGEDGPKFAVARYGNVFCSRGSVVPLFLEQKKRGLLTITDERMTRFTLTLKDASHFVLNCMANMVGGEVFVPKLPSYNVMQLANVIAPEAKKKVIGSRPGEKLHEMMVSIEESYHSIDTGDFIIVLPTTRDKFMRNYEKVYKNNTELEKGKNYNSNENVLMSNEDLDELIKEYIFSNVVI